MTGGAVRRISAVLVGALLALPAIGLVGPSASADAPPGEIRSFTIEPPVLVPPMPAGDTVKLTALGDEGQPISSPSDLHDLSSRVVWESSDTTVAVVDSRGLVTAVAPGTATVNASSGPLWAALGGVSITVDPAITSLVATLSTSATVVRGVLSPGSTLQASAAALRPDSPTPVDETSRVVWRTSDPSVAGVDASGRITGVSPGTAEITASYGTHTATLTLLVVPAPLQAVAVVPGNASLPAATSLRHTAVGTFADSSTLDITQFVDWTSSDPSIAQVSSTGEVTGIALGTADITATASALSPGISASTNVTVVPTDTGLDAITISPPEAAAPLGSTSRFVATGHYGSVLLDISDAVTWSSSDPPIAHMECGIVGEVGDQRVACGMAVTAGEGTSAISAGLGSLSATAMLTVTPVALTSIEVTPAVTVIGKDGAQQLVATGTWSDGATGDITGLVTWSSATPAVATVDGYGVVSPVGPGGTTVSASSGEVTGSATVNVTWPSLIGVSITPDPATLSPGQTLQLHATGHYADGSSAPVDDRVVWTFTTSDGAATVDGDGLVTANGPSSSPTATTATATVTLADGSTVVGSTSIAVVLPAPTIVASATLTTGGGRPVLHFAASVADIEGTAIQHATVTFTSGKSSCSVATDAAGHASCSTPMAGGPHQTFTADAATPNGPAHTSGPVTTTR